MSALHRFDTWLARATCRARQHDPVWAPGGRGDPETRPTCGRCGETLITRAWPGGRWQSVEDWLRSM